MVQRSVVPVQAGLRVKSPSEKSSVTWAAAGMMGVHSRAAREHHKRSMARRVAFDGLPVILAKYQSGASLDLFYFVISGFFFGSMDVTE